MRLSYAGGSCKEVNEPVMFLTFIGDNSSVSFPTMSFIVSY